SFPALDEPRRARALAALARLRAEGRVTITLRDAGPLLSGYGLPLPDQVLARTGEEARAGARQLGFPLAMKIESPKILHKTEIGGVRLGVASVEAVDTAFRDLMAAGAKAVVDASDIDGVLMQPMVRANTEMIVGSTRDPRLGHVMVAGV